MPDNPFHVVDVFARERYTGNQLAVFHDAADLDGDEMLALTRETNFSECTFLVGEADGGYDVRIFDPAEEIPFAGHPTLGTAYVLREFVRENCPDELTLNLGVGPIDVRVERGGDNGAGDDGEHVDGGGGGGDELYWMRQIAPDFGGTVPRSLAARLLGLDESDLDDYPVQTVSTGLPTLVVPLASLGAVERAGTTDPAYTEFIEEYGGHNVLVFTNETEADGDLHARVFADWAGVPEDPATGSSNGCLAAWLVEHRYFAAREVDVRVEQGFEMDRPSTLHLRAEAEGDDVAVEVGGRVSPVAEGRLL
ncbi:PhzF family phenazine biosynthesis protein [Halorarum halophilum]|uniref:PhzF family phenazine biosynthesis protein n=1 Tax=Halorarum halophilum TaxID=2743090 RepID=A0A7D5KEN6_9EURY|nr:PhzF family phenazine biosynthesis protein [Halobaculum halophilum]QLG26956.1 PhzF family phenazine biosynthesis protein [Halobaculum halophilum]